MGTKRKSLTMYICKNCGTESETKPRFCQSCGSYFIDANDTTDGIEWKGVIMADGTVSDRAKITSSKPKDAKGRYAPQMTTSEKVWGILAIIFAAHSLMILLLDYIADSGLVLLGIPFFILALVGIRHSAGKMKNIARLMIVLNIILFIIFMLYIVN